jgi:hypothetical protein
VLLSWAWILGIEPRTHAHAADDLYITIHHASSRFCALIFSLCCCLTLQLASLSQRRRCASLLLGTWRAVSTRLRLLPSAPSVVTSLPSVQVPGYDSSPSTRSRRTAAKYAAPPLARRHPCFFGCQPRWLRSIPSRVTNTLIIRPKVSPPCWCPLWILMEIRIWCIDQVLEAPFSTEKYQKLAVLWAVDNRIFIQFV